MPTPVALPPVIDAETGAPFIGGVGGFTTRAWDAQTGALRDDPPLVSQVDPDYNLFVVSPTDDDESTGIVVEVDFGAANSPRYAVVGVCNAARGNQTFGYGLYNEDGTRWAGSAATVDVWNGGDALAQLKLDDGVFVAQPSTDDISNGAQGLLRSPDTAQPAQYTVSTEALGGGGSAPAAPTVGSFTPAVAAALQSKQPLQFTVTTPGMLPLKRIIVLAQFSNLNIFEVVYDGAAFSERYPASLGNKRVNESGGKVVTFTMLRREGWPASLRLVVQAFDAYGGLNSQAPTYAWTLV